MDEEPPIEIAPARKVIAKKGSLLVVVPPKIIKFLGLEKGSGIAYILDKMHKKVYMVKARNAYDEMEKLRQELGLKPSDISLEFSVSEELAKKILKEK